LVASDWLLVAVLNVQIRCSDGGLFAVFRRPNPTAKGDDMKPSTKDQVEGKFHEMKGKVKEKTGKATNNPDLMDEGTVEKVSGTVQKKIGQVEKVFEK
jgi:uncharacterized protein YjbJ (UPF0337 family)